MFVELSLLRATGTRLDRVWLKPEERRTPSQKIVLAPLDGRSRNHEAAPLAPHSLVVNSSNHYNCR
jgi:hypothetical protein